ncbi:DNA adenine methylase, partial [Serratia marcescens]
MSNKPALKWLGGKARIIDTLRQYLPEGKRLVEPFVGSGAVFLNTDYESYLLCDINSDLINFHNVAKN